MPEKKKLAKITTLLCCPHCHGYDWQNVDGEEGWAIFECQTCKWQFKIVWTER